MSNEDDGKSEQTLSSSPLKQTPVVHIQAPSTDGPVSAPVGFTPEEETVEESQERAADADTDKSEAPSAPGAAPDSDEPSLPASESDEQGSRPKPAVEEKESPSDGDESPKASKEVSTEAALDEVDLN